MKGFKFNFSESVRYVLAGAVTSAVNLGTFFILSRGFSINYLISNGIAWLLTVITGFMLDKRFVFKTRHAGKKELFQFFGSRVISLFADQLMIWALVSVVGLGSSIAKIVDSAAVVVINYILSKKIFKNSRRGGGKR